MPDAKVSVVIPSYNCARYLAPTVDSVLAQTYRPWEIIVVDDGSTDRSMQVLKPYGRAIKYLYQENRGEPAARNLGIRSATGEFVACLDADDLWLPDKLELQMGYFAEHPNCALVYTDTSTFDDSGVLDESLRVRFNQTFASGNLFCQLFRETIFGSGSVVFRKSCVERVGHFDEEFLIGSDYEMWLRIARHFEMGYIDKPLLMYRQHAAMSTRQVRCLASDGTPWEVAVLKKILRLYPEAVQNVGEDAINERFSKIYSTYAHHRFRDSDYALARELFGNALRRTPGNMQCWLFYMLTFLGPSQVSAFRKIYRKMRSGPVSKAAQSQARVAS